MTASDVVRVRVDPQLKKTLSAEYAAQGTTISQKVRTFLYEEASRFDSPLDEFDRIMDAADTCSTASGYSEPTIEDVVT